MEIKISIKKEYLMILVGLLGIAFAVAYGSNNPQELGHSAGEVEVTINGNITTLQQAIERRLLGGETTVRINNQTMTLQQAIDASLFSPNLMWTPVEISLGELPWRPRDTRRSYNIPSTIPASAREILVYVLADQIVAPRVFRIYTKEGSARFLAKLQVGSSCPPESACALQSGSEDFWLPITAERKIYVEVSDTLDQYPARSGIEILGYR